MINELTRKNAHTELDHIFKTILPAHGMTERPEQICLSHTMLDAMCENRIALSDAGTGIGKTYQAVHNFERPQEKTQEAL